MFSHKKSLNKVERLYINALRFLYKDYVPLYDELLSKSGSATIELKPIRSLRVERCRTKKP